MSDETSAIEYLHALVDNRDIACIAGKWYTIIPLELGRADEAAIFLDKVDK